jgi:hypothetical protein
LRSSCAAQERTVAAIEEIRSLQAHYVRLADHKDWQGLGRLFLPDGSFAACGVADTPQHVMYGVAEITSQIEASVGGGTVLHHRFSFEIDFLLSRRAHGVWAMEDWIDRSHDATVASGAFRTMHGAGTIISITKKWTAPGSSCGSRCPGSSSISRIEVGISVRTTSRDGNVPLAVHPRRGCAPCIKP